jgi:hypothetical protein
MRRVVAIVVLLLGLTACSPNYPPDYVEFLKLSKAEQAARFQKLSFDEQIDRFKRWRNHPYYCEPQIARWTTARQFQVLPELLEKLETAKKDEDRLLYIELFAQFHRFSTDLRRHPDLVNKIEQVAIRMHDHDARPRAMAFIDDMRETVPSYAPDFVVREDRSGPPLPPKPPEAR